MERYKQEFIEFMVDSQVLKFGDFTLKSGRKSPFFMNAGAYVTGAQLRRLGEYYAKAIHDMYGLDFDVLRSLILETAAKAADAPSPRDVQTGPAVRNDTTTQARHLAALADEPALEEIYTLISQTIWETSKKI